MSAWLLIAGLGVLIILLGLSAYFSACETTIFSLNPIQVQRIRGRNKAAGARVAGLLANSPRALSAILTGNTLVNICCASVGYALISRLVPAGWGEVISVPVMTVLVLVFGEITPKRLATLHAERLAPAASLGVVVLQKIFSPLVYLLELSTKKFHKIFKQERVSLNDEELMTVVEVGAEQGALDKDEQVMVDGILRLSELQVSDIMTPRVDMVGIDMRDPVQTHLQTVREARFRRLPVYNRTVDAIEGFLDVPRYLIDPSLNLQRHVSAPLFVPDSISLDDLLITFQREQVAIACVLDEYGGTAGLVTRGDILEILTGGDEPSLRPEEESIRKVGENKWLVDGMTSLEELNHQLDLELEADDADRVSGWCTFHSGSLLRGGQVVTAQGCSVQVLRMRKRRIDQVLLEVLPKNSDEMSEESEMAYLDEEDDD
ncbi:MAG: HlyC/CorC family transporter [Lentisphaerae bacterium]|nr:HlyC/CorC family transporter [Lentisphaerota bacterium]